MKTLIITIIALFAFASTPNYSGSWEYETEYSSFSLELVQKDSIVTGRHFSIMQNGNRIDGSDNEQTIQGTIKDGQLIAKIKSTYEAGEPGTAKISFIGKDSLYFEFITPPSCEYWIPNKVILTKVK